MHKYLRAVGFSKIDTREKLQSIIELTIKKAQERFYTSYEDENVIVAEYIKSFAPGMGLTVCGEIGKDDRFILDYCFPFFRSDAISSCEKVSIERHAANISFAGVLDDERVGITIIFYLQNRIPYIIRKNTNSLTKDVTNLSLTGLSIEGTIMMPLLKKPSEVKKANENKKSRNKLVEAAKNGDEDAMESLTLREMDMYSQISLKIKDNDIYTLVDTYFMPYGVECDQYSVLGEILEVRTVKNGLTDEEVYQMLLLCNEMRISICINKADVLGEPEVGRRFKGTLWLQGYINY